MNESCTAIGHFITEGDCFLYEIGIYKIWKNRAECIYSKFYKFDKPLNIKKKTIYLKNKDYTILKFIDWLQAPKEYIINNNLKLIQYVKRTRRKRTIRNK